jgi:1,4-alpha-glucan branching enzyme
MIKGPGARPGSAVVTFELPASVTAVTANVCGEFNGWSPTALPLSRGADGGWQATIELATGRIWRFRYLLDGEHWENDWAPDGYLPNDFGGHDSVVDLSAAVDGPEAAEAIDSGNETAAAKATRQARPAKPSE